jgi:hypothetical protein
MTFVRRLRVVYLVVRFLLFWSHTLRVARVLLQVGPHLHPNVYDAVVSWLTVLHIDERPKLFKIAYSLLRPGGVWFAADFFQLGKVRPPRFCDPHHNIAPRDLTHKVRHTRLIF